MLDTPEDRKQVQGLIDYWAASLPTASRHAAEDGTANRIKPATTVLAQFAADRVGKVAEEAERWLQSASAEDRRLAQRVLLRLVRKPAQANTFEPVSVSRSTLWALGPAEKVDAVIDALATVRAVRVTPGTERSGDSLELRYAALARVWPRYADWLERRKGFREAVQYWAQHKGESGQKAALLSGELLREAEKYNDLTGEEEAFIEASRGKEAEAAQHYRFWLRVFMVISVVAIVATVAAVWGWIKEDVARNKLRKANAALTAKRQLTYVRLTLRARGELLAAFTSPELEIAQERWDALAKARKGMPAAQLTGDSQVLKALYECGDGGAVSQGNSMLLSADVIGGVRQYRNSILMDDKAIRDQLSPNLKAVREISFRMVTLSATKTLNGLNAHIPYSEVKPYMREFWTQYWGEMLLVEGPEVEDAMEAFGKSLQPLMASIEKPDVLLQKRINTVYTGIPEEKRKQLTSDSSGLRLNADSFAHLDYQANQLDIPKAERDRIKVDLNQIRKDAVNRSVEKPALLDDLKQKLQPLLNALKAELENDVAPYPETGTR